MQIIYKYSYKLYNDIVYFYIKLIFGEVYKMAKKYLVTSALPYVNNNLHIGHLVGCLLPSDVYARFCRAIGRDVLFVCGADEHGTPAAGCGFLSGRSV